MWDPVEYARFADERGRPFADLLARVGARDPRRVVDLGCGPGRLTATLAARWPDASIEGVDSSPEMFERARAEHSTDRVRFALGDISGWAPGEPVDVIVSSAALQWVPSHVELLPALLAALAPGGWLAFQVPGNFTARSHTELADVLALPRWRARLAAADLPSPDAEEPAVYLDRLLALGASADVWETTYLHVLEGEDAVLRWVSGTALRPVLNVLDDAEAAEFTAEYGARLRAAYPRGDYGTVLPFRRIFAVAQVAERCNAG